MANFCRWRGNSRAGLMSCWLKFKVTKRKWIYSNSKLPTSSEQRKNCKMPKRQYKGIRKWLKSSIKRWKMPSRRLVSSANAMLISTKRTSWLSLIAATLKSKSIIWAKWWNNLAHRLSCHTKHMGKISIYSHIHLKNLKTQSLIQHYLEIHCFSFVEPLILSWQSLPIHFLFTDILTITGMEQTKKAELFFN